MAKNRITRKQLLNEPDEFITTTTRIIDWAKENLRLLIIGACVFLGVAVSISIYTYHRQRQTNMAETLLGQALAKYQATMETKDTVAALDAVRKDFDGLLASYANVPAGRVATVMYGNICLAGQDYNDAVIHYKAALPHFGVESNLSNVILNGLGTAYQKMGDYNKAVSYFKQIADGTGTILKDASLFNLGWLYRQLGRSDESNKAYERLGVEFPQSMYADLVKGKSAGS
jgi:tetratricopeptide (TPR) repeat protein